MVTTNLFVIANIKLLRTGGSFRILLPFFRTSWCVRVLNLAIFKGIQIGFILAGFRRAFRISGGGEGYEHHNTPRAVRHCTETFLEISLVYSKCQIICFITYGS